MVMRTMRNNINVLKYMFVLLLIVFGIGLVMPNSNSRELASAAAVVDGIPVDGQRYSKVVQSRLEGERQAQGGELTEGESLRVRRDTLQELIEEELALANAASLGQKSSLDEFRQAVLSDPNFKDQKTGQYDPRLYERLLNMQAQQQGMDWKQSEAYFQRQMLLQKVHGFFSDQALLTPAEQAAAEAKLNRQVRAQAAVWDVAKLKAAQKLTEEEIETYYSENKQSWAKPEQLKLRQILVKTDFAMASSTAKTKADGILAKLKTGADFKTLAKAENSDTAAKENGGDLGWMTRADLRDPVLGGEAFKLKPGQLSGVVQTAEGFHILKAEDRKAGFEPNLQNSRAKAQDELAARRARSQASQFASLALADLKKGTTLDAAAKAHQGSVTQTGWFGIDTEAALPALGKSPSFAHDLLSLDKGERPENPTVTEKAAAFAVITEEKAGPAPAKPEAAASRRRQALGLARSKKADELYKAWVGGLRSTAKIKDQSGVLPIAN
jgi:parvulin-like peptidyl-prolyl isomerase